MKKILQNAFFYGLIGVCLLIYGKAIKFYIFLYEQYLEYKKSGIGFLNIINNNKEFISVNFLESIGLLFLLYFFAKKLIEK